MAKKRAGGAKKKKAAKVKPAKRAPKKVSDFSGKDCKPR